MLIYLIKRLLLVWGKKEEKLLFHLYEEEEKTK